MQIIEQLKHNALIWQGGQTAHVGECCGSGYRALDSQLNGGLPRQGIIEIRSALGIGELRLILPYLKQRADNGLIIFIAPPSMLSAESLHFSGLDLAKTLILTADDNDALWCAEQCLKSGSCASVVLWHQHFEIHQIRRLTLACEQGEASLILLRDSQADSLSLPVRLTLSVKAHRLGVEVKINKRRAGAPSPAFVVNMAERWPEFSSPILPANVVSLTEFKRQAV